MEYIIIGLLILIVILVIFSISKNINESKNSQKFLVIRIKVRAAGVNNPTIVNTLFVSKNLK